MSTVEESVEDDPAAAEAEQQQQQQQGQPQPSARPSPPITRTAAAAAAATGGGTGGIGVTGGGPAGHRRGRRATAGDAKPASPKREVAVVRRQSVSKVCARVVCYASCAVCRVSCVMWSACETGVALGVVGPLKGKLRRAEE